MNSILINGKKASQISVNDRGFQYGDGVFETIACKNRSLIYWNEHLQRLNNACSILKLAITDENTWLKDIEKIIKTHDEDQVIKLIYSRGEGQRGYKLPDPTEPVRIVMSSPMPVYTEDMYHQGVSLMVCKTPASSNSRLAGLKHLNKLDIVLARSEWSDETIFEGLMLDDYGNVIEGTMSNFFAVKNNSLYTPILKRSGVNGIIRQRIIDLAKNDNIVTQQIEIKLDKLLEMDEIFITNSLIGLCPVNQLESNRYKTGPITRHLMMKLQQDIKGREL
ncbi:MAG: aminodeoxychorismate lyase [Gammaproteobacteria bacterium]|nr:aminodeoxychorismate lyase [Gammaproteobacteria bacterium]